MRRSGQAAIHPRGQLTELTPRSLLLSGKRQARAVRDEGLATVLIV